MTSLANDGPDRNTAGCLRHSASGMSSDIIAPVPTSRPLLTQMIGTCAGSRSCNSERGWVSKRGGLRATDFGLEDVHDTRRAHVSDSLQTASCHVVWFENSNLSFEGWICIRPGKPTLMLVRKARLCCTGTACTAYCAPAIACAMLVVAVTFTGISWSCNGARLLSVLAQYLR